MTQQFRASAALPGSDSTPSTHMEDHKCLELQLHQVWHCFFPLHARGTQTCIPEKYLYIHVKMDEKKAETLHNWFIRLFFWITYTWKKTPLDITQHKVDLEWTTFITLVPKSRIYCIRAEIEQSFLPKEMESCCTEIKVLYLFINLFSSPYLIQMQACTRCKVLRSLGFFSFFL